MMQSPRQRTIQTDTLDTVQS
eukprot:COSAG01_NODE_74660_length_204_cov_218.361905_1_plen_20_part_01